MIPEFMIRVKLPSPHGFPPGPSGDTDCQSTRIAALADALPRGFEYIYPRAGVVWPKDIEGWTWAPLRCRDDSVALNHWMARARYLEKLIDQMRTLVEEHQPLHVPKDTRS